MLSKQNFCKILSLYHKILINLPEERKWWSNIGYVEKLVVILEMSEQIISTTWYSIISLKKVNASIDDDNGKRSKSGLNW